VCHCSSQSPVNVHLLKNSQAGVALKSLGKKSWEIKGGGQEWLQ